LTHFKKTSKMEEKDKTSLFIAFFPNEMEEHHLLGYLAVKLSTPADSLDFLYTGRRLFTNHRVITFKKSEIDKKKLQNFLGSDPEIEGHPLYICEYFGMETYLNFEEKYSGLCVFLTGIPMSQKFEFLYGVLSELAPIKDLYIPKRAHKKNKHFGFVNFENVNFKKKFLAFGKIKGKKFRLVFRDFNPEDLKRLNRDLQEKLKMIQNNDKDQKIDEIIHKKKPNQTNQLQKNQNPKNQNSIIQPKNPPNSLQQPPINNYPNQWQTPLPRQVSTYQQHSQNQFSSNTQNRNLQKISAKKTFQKGRFPMKKEENFYLQEQNAPCQRDGNRAFGSPYNPEFEFRVNSGNRFRYNNPITINWAIGFDKIWHKEFKNFFYKKISLNHYFSNLRFNRINLNIENFDFFQRDSRNFGNFRRRIQPSSHFEENYEEMGLYNKDHRG